MVVRRFGFEQRRWRAPPALKIISPHKYVYQTISGSGNVSHGQRRVKVKVIFVGLNNE
jgi:hypothetical protein